MENLRIVNQDKINACKENPIWGESLIKPLYEFKTNTRAFKIMSFVTEDKQIHYSVSYEGELGDSDVELTVDVIPVRNLLKADYYRTFPENKDIEVRVLIQRIPNSTISVFVVRPLNFKDVFKFPLELDDFGDIVYTKNRERAFDFSEEVSINQGYTSQIAFQSIFIKILNNTLTPSDTKISLGELYHENGEVLAKAKENSDPDHILTIRGFGHLTGTGGLNLSPIEARRLQDEFADYIVNKINSKSKN